MSHYWTADDPEAARQVQLEDWIEDLFEFSDAIVEEACREWRRIGTRRPLPVDIRVLAIAEQRRIAERGVTEEAWPKWLQDLWGPEPAGPIKRKQALEKNRQLKNCWEPGYFTRYDEPWFAALPIEDQRHFKEQDLARAEARRVGDPNFVALCVSQAKENVERVARRSKGAFAPAMTDRQRDEYIAGRRPIPGQRGLSQDEANAALRALSQCYGLPE
jgi:hypothetical protein